MTVVLAATQQERFVLVCVLATHAAVIVHPL